MNEKSRTRERGRKSQKPNLSRRRLIQALGLGSIAAAAGLGYVISSIAENATDTKFYRGPIEDIKGYEFIPKTDLLVMTQALTKTNIPFLKKVASDIERVSVSTEKPPEFPRWVLSDRVLIPVTQHNSDVAYAFPAVNLKPLPESITPITQANTLRGREIESLYIATQIPSIPGLIREGPLARGFYLAKEHLTLMLALKMAEEFASSFMIPKGVRYVDKDGSLLTDPHQLRMAGAVSLLTAIKNEDSEWHQLWDMLPAMLLAPIAEQLRLSGTLRSQGSHLGSFYGPGQAIESNPNIRSSVTSIRDQWVSGKTFLPPDGITQAMSQDPLKSATLSLRKTIQNH